MNATKDWFSVPLTSFQWGSLLGEAALVILSSPAFLSLLYPSLLFLPLSLPALLPLFLPQCCTRIHKGVHLHSKQDQELVSFIGCYNTSCRGYGGGCAWLQPADSNVQYTYVVAKTSLLSQEVAAHTYVFSFVCNGRRPIQCTLTAEFIQNA